MACSPITSWQIERENVDAVMTVSNPRIKIAGRNINNLRNAYNTILMAESEEELESLLMKVKEEREKLA